MAVKLLGMTTTMSDDAAPPPPPPPPPPFGADPGWGGFTPPPGDSPPLLRRSSEDRIGVGLCGGLGQYFRVDPVLFRVAFAVLALFGGSGIVLYLLGWAAIPEQGAQTSTLDRMIAELRRRHVPFGLVAAVALIAGWALLFSWWAPRGLIPAVIVGAILLVVLGRRPTGVLTTATGRRRDQPDPSYQATAPFPAAGVPFPAGGVSFEKTPAPGDAAATADQPTSQLRSWFTESQQRARLRRSRSRPVLAATVALAVLTLLVMALVDAATGIPFAAYFWTLGGIVLGGLLVGLVTRRTPWSVLPLLVPALAGVVVFGSSPTSAHDGWGDTMWQPANSAAVAPAYKVAFGRGTLDLTDVTAVSGDRTIDVTQGAGQSRLIIPRTLPVRVVADVHMGSIENGTAPDVGGYNFTRSYQTPAVATATGGVLTIHVRLSAGQVSITYV